MWRKRSIAYAPLIAFLPGFAISWPVTMLYFEVVSPGAGHHNAGSFTPYLAGGERYQLCLLVFVLGYGAVTWLQEYGRTSASDLMIVSDNRCEWRLVQFAMLSAAVGPLATVMESDGVLRLFFGGLRNYGSALVFLAGYRWAVLRRGQRLFVVVGLAVVAVVNTIGNARGYALYPLASALVGYFFARDVVPRTKAIVLGVVVLTFPLYLVMGNQTRLVLGSIGLDDPLARASVLSQALEGRIQFETGGYMEDAMARLFLTGGQAIINENWGKVSLLDFDFFGFSDEAWHSLLPAYAFGKAAEGKYVGSARLRDYGFNVDERTSYEVSMVGSLYGYGGLWMVFMGGLLAAAIHRSLLAMWVRRKSVGTAGLARIAGGVAVNMWGWNVDVVSHVRSHLWTLAYVTLATWAIVFLRYVIKRATLGPPEAR